MISRRQRPAPTAPGSHGSNDSRASQTDEDMDEDMDAKSDDEEKGGDDEPLALQIQSVGDMELQRVTAKLLTLARSGGRVSRRGARTRSLSRKASAGAMKRKRNKDLRQFQRLVRKWRSKVLLAQATELLVELDAFQASEAFRCPCDNSETPLNNAHSLRNHLGSANHINAVTDSDDAWNKWTRDLIELAPDDMVELPIPVMMLVLASGPRTGAIARVEARRNMKRTQAFVSGARAMSGVRFFRETDAVNQGLLLMPKAVHKEIRKLSASNLAMLPYDQYEQLVEASAGNRQGGGDAAATRPLVVCFLNIHQRPCLMPTG